MSIRSYLREVGMPDVWKNYDKDDWLYDFTEELARRGVIRMRDHHEVWGKYYGIPACCIENFIQLEESGIQDIFFYMLDKHKDYLMDYNYVPCSDCIAKYAKESPTKSSKSNKEVRDESSVGRPDA